MKRTLVFAIASALVMSVSAPAFARNEVRESTTISYADLDMTTAAGGETLYGRIRAAARQVCAEQINPTGFTKRACVRETVGRTIASLDMPMLTLAHEDARPAPSMTLAAR